jgi:hypothetical protein
VSAKEYASELLPFGDPNEPLLKACIDHIKGVKSAPVIRGTDLRSYKSSDDFSPMGRNMVREMPLPDFQK